MPSVRRKLILYFILVTISLLLAAGVAVSWFVAGALVAPSPRVVGAPPAGLNATAFSIASNSGSSISGWHTQPEQCRGVVVLLHGIHGSRLTMLDRARLLHQAGYATVLIDLHAHGESPGDAVTLGYLEKHDVCAAVEFARRNHVDQPIGVIGVSLGGAAAVLASPLDIDALVIESVYPDIDAAVHNRVAETLGPISAIPSTILLMQLKPRLGFSPSQLRPIDHISDVGCPVLVASGTDDHHTTVLESRRIFAEASGPKELWLIDGAAHVDLHAFDPIQYEHHVLGFLDRHLGERPR